MILHNISQEIVISTRPWEFIVHFSEILMDFSTFAKCLEKVQSSKKVQKVLQDAKSSKKCKKCRKVQKVHFSHLLHPLSQNLIGVMIF